MCGAGVYEKSASSTQFLCEPKTVVEKKEKKREVKVLVAQSCPALCDPEDCSLPGSSVRGILQSKILEWVAISFSRGSSWTKDWTQVCIAGRFSTIWDIKEKKVY